MSLERVLAFLEDYGLTKMDANLYVYIAQKGAKTSDELALAIGAESKEDLSRRLLTLEEKGLIIADSEQRTYYTALPFEELLDQMISRKNKELQAAKLIQKDLLTHLEASGAEH